MKKALFLVLLFCSTALAAETFYIKNVSKKFDVEIEVAECKNGFCKGKAKFSLFKEHIQKPFQIINLNETSVSLDENGQPEIAKIKDKKRGKWSSVYLEDFNFDGLEDLAISDGRNGGYAGTSYRVYLYSNRKKQFVFNSNFTRLVQGPYMGIFVIDYKEKTLETMWKSGAGFHEVQRYTVVKGRPKKVYELTEDAMLGNGKKYITTKKLINGKWRTRVKQIKY